MLITPIHQFLSPCLLKRNLMCEQYGKDVITAAEVRPVETTAAEPTTMHATIPIARAQWQYIDGDGTAPNSKLSMSVPCVVALPVSVSTASASIHTMVWSLYAPPCKHIFIFQHLLVSTFTPLFDYFVLYLIAMFPAVRRWGRTGRYWNLRAFSHLRQAV